MPTLVEKPLVATMPDRAPSRTMADILHALGDIPGDRVVWLDRPATEADVLAHVDGEPKRLVELVDGFLVEKAMGNQSGLFALSVATLINEFVRPRRLGVVGGADCLMRLKPGQVRLPDVYFTPWSRMPAKNAHRHSFADYPPDLAVEVLSPSNTRAEIRRKRDEYFAAGTRLVWIFDPKTETVEVYTDPTAFTTLTAADTMTGDPVLPGFTLVLKDLFEDPQVRSES